MAPPPPIFMTASAPAKKACLSRAPSDMVPGLCFSAKTATAPRISTEDVSFCGTCTTRGPCAFPKSTGECCAKTCVAALIRCTRVPQTRTSSAQGPPKGQPSFEQLAGPKQRKWQAQLKGQVLAGALVSIWNLISLSPAMLKGIRDRVANSPKSSLAERTTSVAAPEPVTTSAEQCKGLMPPQRVLTNDSASSKVSGCESFASCLVMFSNFWRLCVSEVPVPVGACSGCRC
mmetsp:Transcript_121522/g.288865  ORF Transcript_121522/g.288865 Transcript_121522/m.288865 type:complete len:231 (+) Transcript_121522:996-1688(+)